MRMVMIALGLFSAAALACTSPGSGCGYGCPHGETTLIETLTYAVNELGLEENSDIQTALRLYKKEMRSIKTKIPAEAFSDGKFYPEAYAKNAPPARALQAQIDLFETVYLILSDEQKKEFPRLMGMYEHHIQYALPPKGYGCGSGGYGDRCDLRSRANCGPHSSPAPRKKGSSPKR